MTDCLAVETVLTALKAAGEATRLRVLTLLSQAKEFTIYAIGIADPELYVLESSSFCAHEVEFLPTVV